MNKGFIKGKNENEVIPSEDLGTDKKNIETKEKRHIIGTREETNVEKGELYEYRNYILPKKNIGSNIGTKMMSVGSYLALAIPFIGIPLTAAGFATQKISSKVADENVIIQKRKIIKSKEYLIAYNIFNDKTEEEASRTFIKETIEEGNWVDVREM